MLNMFTYKSGHFTKSKVVFMHMEFEALNTNSLRFEIFPAGFEEISQVQVRLYTSYKQIKKPFDVD